MTTSEQSGMRLEIQRLITLVGIRDGIWPYENFAPLASWYSGQQPADTSSHGPCGWIGVCMCVCRWNASKCVACARMSCRRRLVATTDNWAWWANISLQWTNDWRSRRMRLTFSSTNWSSSSSNNMAQRSFVVFTAFLIITSGQSNLT